LIELKNPGDASSEGVVGQAVRAYTADNDLPIFSDVLLPEGAKEQLRLLREQDLFGVSLPEKYGGAALSQMVNGASLLMIAQADASLFLRVMLTEGVADLLDNFANAPLKDQYIPLLCSGDPENNYVGAMVITESGAGSDFRGMLVKAVKNADKYLIGGRKIFITNPDADVSIVLSRIDGAPLDSLKGLTLFLVPKYLADESGKKIRNRILIENLENKLGIHASPTGTMLFKGAEAFRIGKEGEGLEQMLTLMNRSRLAIGIQGLGIAERAFLESATYCMERKQFGKTLAELPLMQEILVDMRVEIEAATSLIFRAYHFMDKYFGLREKSLLGELSDSEKIAMNKNYKFLRILTPLAKCRCSKLSISIADRAVSNFGGYGYINEYKVERLIRDAKITTIYEGTNNMMVLDVQRSITNEGTLDEILADIGSTLEEINDQQLIPYKNRILKSVEYLKNRVEKISRSEDQSIASQVEAGKFAEILTTVFEAALMLEEGQYLIAKENDWRKAVMAMKYIDDKFLPLEQKLTGKLLSRKYFDSIFYREKLSCL
jgi:alkylation response protein AidB-like acyl-CoA dehydrogenase